MAPVSLGTLVDGWFSGARAVPSPNQDERPYGVSIDLLVIHAISLPPDVFGGDDVERLFTNTLDCDTHPFYDGLRDLRVSAHLYIRRNGEVVQFVGLNQRAWHAGVSRFGDRERCNDFSIGVEMEGCDTKAFADVQYPALVALTIRLREAFPEIVEGHIVGHSDIAPGRKTDPGPLFDWGRFRSAMRDGTA